MTTVRKQGALVLALAMVLAACGADDGDVVTAPEPADATSTAAADDLAQDDHDEDFAWGTPAEDEEATRTIEITADDDFTFDPADVEVEAGETVTFAVANVGQLEHDFTLGDAETQQAHEEEMAEMDGMDHGTDEANTLTLPPGETVETTWTFTQPGETLIGCHVPGHYAAGMRGAVTIAEGS